MEYGGLAIGGENIGESNIIEERRRNSAFSGANNFLPNNPEAGKRRLSHFQGSNSRMEILSMQSGQIKEEEGEEEEENEGVSSTVSKREIQIGVNTPIAPDCCMSEPPTPVRNQAEQFYIVRFFWKF
jgi:hypothetical protein